MNRKIFTHTPIKKHNLTQVNLPGLRYYTKRNSDKKFVSITSIISHNNKDKFVDWRKKIGNAEAIRITNRSTTRGTKTHSLIEAYVGNEPQPLLESIFNSENESKIETLLNPYDVIRAKKNKVTINIYKDRKKPLKISLSASSKDVKELLTLFFDEYGEITFEDESDNKNFLLNTTYEEFVSYCINNIDSADFYKESIETYKSLPYRLFENIRPELDKIDNILGIEIPLFSEYFEIAGTSDCIAEYNGILSIIDYKTSEYIKKKEWIFDYFVQAVAYRYMLKELTGLDAEQLVIFMTAENGETKVFTETNFQPYTEKLVQYIRNFKNAKIKELKS